MDGLILVDKPLGLTSHDVVARIRRILDLRQVGHFGTLDPLATGLLLIGVGKATRLFPVLSGEDKAYAGRIRLGLATDTYDATGRPISEPSEDYPGQKELVRAMQKLTGTIEQLPPPYSAKKVGGRPLYKWARMEKAVEMRPHRVTVYAFRLTRYAAPDVEVEVECSSGTYIRSLAHDLGQSLGCGAHLAALSRTRVGNFRLKDALTMEKIEELAARNRAKECLIPLESLFPEWPKVILNREGEEDLRKGKSIAAQQVVKTLKAKPERVATGPDESLFRLFSLEGRFLGLARADKDRQKIMPFLLLR